MSFALLWIETLITTLLWVAMVDCWAVRRKRWTALAARIIARILPVLPLGIFVTVGGIMKNAEIEPSWIEYSLTLLLAYLIGAIWIWRSGRRIVDGIISVKLWPAKRLATYLLVSAVLTNMTLWNMDLAVQSRAAVLKVEAGSLVLAACPPVASDLQNAAPLYEKAFAQLNADPNWKTVDPDGDINSPTIIDILKRHSSTIALLRKGSELPVCRFDRDFAHPSISIVLPELNSSRQAALILRLQVRRELQDGQIAQAVSDVDSILRLGRHFGQGPALIYCLVSFGINKIGFDTLQEVLPRIDKSEQLSAIDLSDVDSPRRILRRGLLGEEGFGLGAIADIAANRMSASAFLGDDASTELADYEPTGAIFRVFFLSGEADVYAKYMENYQRASQTSAYQVRSDVAELKKMKLGLLTRVILPSVVRIAGNSVRSQAIQSAAQAAIAVVRYRLDHGVLPDKLDDLVPGYLDEVPLDPFNGKPLQLEKKADQWTIYSVGPGAKVGAAPPATESDEGPFPGFVLKLTRPKTATAPAQ